MKAVTIYLNVLNSLLLSAPTNFAGVPLFVCVNAVLAFVGFGGVEIFVLGACFQ